MDKMNNIDKFLESLHSVTTEDIISVIKNSDKQQPEVKTRKDNLTATKINDVTKYGAQIYL